MTSSSAAFVFAAVLLSGYLVPDVGAQMYDYGISEGHTAISLSGDDQTCFDFPTVRIMDSLTSGSTDIADHLVGGKLCISQNGGLAFTTSTLPTGTFADVTTDDNSQEAAILPLYLDYKPTIGLPDGATGGIYYDAITDDTVLASYAADVATCGLTIDSFEACWGVIVTWSDLQANDAFDLLADPSPSNTFQVVLLGNAGDAIFVIINYGKLSVADISGAQTRIQGAGLSTRVHDIVGDVSTTMGNCVNGRSVYMISDDAVLEPGDTITCADVDNCGRYGDLLSPGAGTSGTCSGAVCDCAGGYTGLYCLNDDEKNCNPTNDPCDPTHTLLCEDTGLGADVAATERYTCHCETGYTGDLCDTAILACDSNPCMNGGTCNDIPFDFDCDCPPEWTGTTCTEDVDECTVADPCVRGTCVNILAGGGYTCTCDIGSTGTNCDCSDWGAFSTGCRTADNWDGLCGGCGIQTRTRGCDWGSTDSTTETQNCNVKSCSSSRYLEKTQRKPVTRNVKRTIVRTRKCCYKFLNDGTPVELNKEKFCVNVKNGLV